MAKTQVAKQIEFLNPGNLDGSRGPYATIADACDAIPNNIVDGRSLREGKIVDIGVEPNTIEYRWVGGFNNEHLVPYLGEVESKLAELKPRFPFHNESDPYWYNIFRGFIVDLHLDFPKNPSLYYSFAIIQKQPGYVSLRLYSATSPSGNNFSMLGEFSANTDQGYNPSSMVPFTISNSLGKVVIIPGAIGTTDQTGLGYGSLGLDDDVFIKGSRFHYYLNEYEVGDKISEVSTKLDDLSNSINPTFPFWNGVDAGWYGTLKPFILDVNLTIERDPNLFYSFAIIQKQVGYVSIRLYSATDRNGSGNVLLGVFDANINDGYDHESLTPYLIQKEGLGSIVIAPGSVNDLNISGLFYYSGGLDNEVFTVNSKQNFFIKKTEVFDTIISPIVDFSTILNRMFFRNQVTFEFIGDSITVGQEGGGVTIAQTLYDALISAYNEFSPPNTPGSSLNISVINKGIGGSTIKSGLDIIKANTGSANVSFIMYGYNDMRYNIPAQYVPPVEYKSILEEIVRIAISQDKLPILGIEPSVSTAFQTGMLAPYRSAIIEVAEKYKLTYVDFGKQTWDVIFRPDGLHFNNNTYYAMGFDLAGYFTTMNYFNNIEVGKGDEIGVSVMAHNVTNDIVRVENAGGVDGYVYVLTPGKSLSFSLNIRDNCDVFVRVLNLPGGGSAGKFRVNNYKSLKNPLPEFVPSSSNQKIALYNTKAGKRTIIITNTDAKDLIINTIGFE